MNLDSCYAKVDATPIRAAADLGELPTNVLRESVKAEHRVQTDCGRFVVVRSSFPLGELEEGLGMKLAPHVIVAIRGHVAPTLASPSVERASSMK